MGEVIQGKYRVEGVLGAGGMGVVVAARHLGLDERVAIKFLGANVRLEERTVERFLREGRAAVKIRGEHVARMMDVGTLEDGSPFLVMEYLEGTEVGRKLREEGPLPVPLALTIVLQTCEALAEAHALGIVHRDLKPANLFLDVRPDQSVRVKVLDFGISKTPFEEASGTTSAHVLGTPHYMSPEQLKSSRDLDARADIWALGVILYELLTGKHAFDGESVPRVFANILDHEPIPLRQHLPNVPPKLAQVIEVCLKKEPTWRYPDVAALARGLADAGAPDGLRAAERISRILGASAKIPPSVAFVADAMADGIGTTEGLTRDELARIVSASHSRRFPKRRWPAAVLGVLGIAALVSTAWVFHLRAQVPAAASAVQPIESPAVVPPAAQPTASTVPELLPPDFAVSTASAAASTAPPSPAESHAGGAVRLRPKGRAPAPPKSSTPSPARTSTSTLDENRK